MMRTRPVAAIQALLVVATACGPGARDGGTGDAAIPPGPFDLGQPVAAAEVAALDFDVEPSGRGLPPGRGDAVRGAEVYRTTCASCHGERGEGIAPNPRLIGREPREGFPFAADPKLVKTIGNYWPHATTLFDYIRRSMPLAAPGSLTGDDVYSVTAFLLAANEVIPAGSALDSAALVAVRMPARDHFVRDDRRGGAQVR
jgi:cytochrome c